MADRNNYLSVPSTFISGTTEDDSSGDDAEDLDFVVVQNCDSFTKTETFRIFEGQTHDLERERLFQRSDYVKLQRNEISELQSLYVRKEKVEQDTLKSLGRCLNLLHQSEEAASSTGQELLRQREQLERVDRRMEDMHGSLQENKKHIRGLQSMLGGVKNYIEKKVRSRTPSPKNRSYADDGSSNLKSAIHSLNVQKEATCSEKPTNNHQGLKNRELKPAMRESADCSKNSASVDEIVEKNLDDISSSILRLKLFAVSLNEEVDSENKLIDRLIDKTDSANVKVAGQTKELVQITKQNKRF